MNRLIFPIALLGGAITSQAGVILNFPMEADASRALTETVNGSKLQYYGNFNPENIPGAQGDALRLDGYSTYVQGPVKPSGKAEKFSASMWVAPETYPIVEHDADTQQRVIMAGTLNDATRQGWAFTLGKTGRFAFEFYSEGYKSEIVAMDILPRYEWSLLTVVADCANKKITLYRNGNSVGTGRTLSHIDNSSPQMLIGKGIENVFAGNFYVNTFNGLIDDINVYDTLIDPSSISATPEHKADLSIPESRFAADRLRPRFHGMPAAGWTNECHGLIFSGGKYHVFFQKNANGPYMSRLHWGHISSPNLFDWTEEKTAISPDKAYDIKGCWSGHVFSDPKINGGDPTIIYTGVDYGRATISMARAQDADLIEWEKDGTNPIINGRPAGLSDDFRDASHFTTGNDSYIIVGSSNAQGIGTATLHRLVNGRFTNDGSLFFSGTSKGFDGTFWEMPNVTDMGQGKYLFTATPLGTSEGVKTIYFTGSINPDGTFARDLASIQPRKLELISRDGYGLLSPSIYNKDGKTIMLGIVPDKLPGADNARLGWAHCYSLPREISLASDGSLIQKPFSGLTAMRGDVKDIENDFNLSGERPIENVKSRSAEVHAKFLMGKSAVGFKFFRNASGEATLKYNPTLGRLEVDFTGIKRLDNDGGSFKGLYSAFLPKVVREGEELDLTLYIDGSILDIFVNNAYATSIRVFPRDADADGMALFAEGATQVKEFGAWQLSHDSSAVEQIFGEGSAAETPFLDVYDCQGRLVKQNVCKETWHQGLEQGIYIAGGKKYIL